MNPQIIGSRDGLSRWLQTPAGIYLRDWETEQFDRVVSDIFGYHGLQLGTPEIDSLRDSRIKTEQEDTILAGFGKLQGLKIVAVVHEFNFMGGSLGIAAGEAIIKAFERAIAEKCPLVMFPASGGARMQEGILSLMQLPRTTVAVDMLKEAGQPYIVVLTNPTTGGVTASYAMLGDIHIAEPGAEICFAGKRVIEQTIREKLPDGFQTSEYLLEHGMVDMVVKRHDIPSTLARLLKILTRKPADDVKVPALAS